MSVRRYRQGDEYQIQTLFNKTFHKERPLHEWEWKFKKNPKYKEPFILVYEEDGKILGNYSLWLSDAYIDGEIKTIGLRVDTMVDPDARGKGIYKKLSDSLLGEASKAGIDYIYGFPAQKAKELLIRYTGASQLAEMPRWIYVQNPFTLLSSKHRALRLLRPLDRFFGKRKKSKSIHGEYVVKKITKFDATFDQLAHETRSIEQGLIVRDSTYLNWRYFEHPSNHYRAYGLYKKDHLQGYVIVKEQTDSFTSGFIVDSLSRDEKSWSALLDAALHDLRNTDVIQSWALHHSVLADSLKNKGFIHKDNPMPLVGNFIDPKLAYMSDSSKWLITLGDVDSF